MPTQEEARERKADAAQTPGGVQDPAAVVAAEREKNERAAKQAARKDKSDAGNAQRQAVEDIANDNGDGDEGEVTMQQAMDAADWFLSPDPEEDVSTKRFRLRVGKQGSKREWVQWEVKSLGRERIQQIRQQNRIAGKRGRPGEMDENAANLRIATEATVNPDIPEMAKRMGLIDPADALNQRFSFKPGLIDQIAAEAIMVSGYDDDDVDEVDAVKS